MYKMDTRSTNKQAEAFAILKALEYVKKITWKTTWTK